MHLVDGQERRFWLLLVLAMPGQSDLNYMLITRISKRCPIFNRFVLTLTFPVTPTALELMASLREIEIFDGRCKC